MNYKLFIAFAAGVFAAVGGVLLNVSSTGGHASDANQTLVKQATVTQKGISSPDIEKPAATAKPAAQSSAPAAAGSTAAAQSSAPAAAGSTTAAQSGTPAAACSTTAAQSSYPAAVPGSTTAAQSSAPAAEPVSTAAAQSSAPAAEPGSTAAAAQSSAPAAAGSTATAAAQSSAPAAAGSTTAAQSSAPAAAASNKKAGNYKAGAARSSTTSATSVVDLAAKPLVSESLSKEGKQAPRGIATGLTKLTNFGFTVALGGGYASTNITCKSTGTNKQLIGSGTDSSLWRVFGGGSQTSEQTTSIARIISNISEQAAKKEDESKSETSNIIAELKAATSTMSGYKSLAFGYVGIGGQYTSGADTPNKYIPNKKASGGELFLRFFLAGEVGSTFMPREAIINDQAINGKSTIYPIEGGILKYDTTVDSALTTKISLKTKYSFYGAIMPGVSVCDGRCSIYAAVVGHRTNYDFSFTPNAPATAGEVSFVRSADGNDFLAPDSVNIGVSKVLDAKGSDGSDPIAQVKKVGEYGVSLGLGIRVMVSKRIGIDARFLKALNKNIKVQTDPYKTELLHDTFSGGGAHKLEIKEATASIGVLYKIGG
ncbi:MAG: hypothetical protein LBG13_01440 [Holosporales bacterium]|nr:hypothetical protein [Holosporales bacterium]